MKKIVLFTILQIAATASLHAQDQAGIRGTPPGVRLAEVHSSAPVATVFDARLLIASDHVGGARDASYQLRPNRPRSALRGAVIGGLITGTAAVVASLITSGASCDEGLCYYWYPYAFALGTVPGTVIGGLVGWNLPDDETPASTEPAGPRR